MRDSYIAREKTENRNTKKSIRTVKMNLLYGYAANIGEIMSIRANERSKGNK